MDNHDSKTLSGLGGTKQTWDNWFVFFCSRHHNEWPEICSTASGKAEYTDGGT